MPTLIDAYASGTPLCFFMTDRPEAVWLVAAMVEVSDGIAVANGSIFDPWASKRTSLHEGSVEGEGPWRVGRWTFAAVEEHRAAGEAWAVFERAAEGEGAYRPEVEAMLRDLYG